jgi:hypothetical protein
MTKGLHVHEADLVMYRILYHLHLSLGDLHCYRATAVTPDRMASGLTDTAAVDTGFARHKTITPPWVAALPS